jgi:hypothetical protein
MKRKLFCMDTVENTISNQLVEFLKNSPSILYGDLRIDGTWESGMFKLEWDKVLRTPMYKFYSDSGKRISALSVKKAFDLVESGQLVTKAKKTYNNTIDNTIDNTLDDI